MGGNAGVREGELFRCARDITNSSINAKKFTVQRVMTPLCAVNAYLLST